MNRLRLERVLRGLSQKAVGVVIGARQADISAYELGAVPSPLHRAALSEHFGVSPAELFADLSPEASLQQFAKRMREATKATRQ